ncbi:unnamed protein product [Phytomonas sp. Hart1]|nr:unnamed protein product [Phytomonas sp. Hart1]|eukprot:CCW66279.1 unnamed protein product [Phytomonas sp. isolate Hart1]
MESIFLTPEFDQYENYRLLKVDGSWLNHLKVNRHTLSSKSVSVGKRHRRPSEPSEKEGEAKKKPQMILWAKGDRSLIACDTAHTRIVRRVEYSNSILVAQRRDGPVKPAVVASADPSQTSHASVVVASLSQIFETRAIPPQHRTHALLANSLLTLEEIEMGTEESIDREVPTAGETSSGKNVGQHLTFVDLVRANDCSPMELVTALRAMGAVVHRGYVRLLDRKILCEALEAVLTYVDAEDEAPTWDQLADYFSSVYLPIVLQVVRTVYGAPTATIPSDAIEDIFSEGPLLNDKWSLFSIPKVLLGLAGHVFEVDPSASLEEVQPGVLAIRMTFESFWDAWRRRIPAEWLKCDGFLSWGDDPTEALTFLRAHIVCYQSSLSTYRDAKIWWLPEYLLPQRIKARVDILFKLSPQKWDAECIRAFIEPLLSTDESFSNIIVRYAREYRIPGEPLRYSHLAT